MALAQAELNRAQQHAESRLVTTRLDEIETGLRDRNTNEDALKSLDVHCPEGTGADTHADAGADVHPHVINDS